MSTLVTGAGGGIGTAIVRSLLSRCESVLAQDISATALRDLEHPRVRKLVGDLRDAACLADIGRTASETAITAVIAAHGIDGSGALCELSREFVQRVVEINAATIPRLFDSTREPLRDGGRFVVIASQAGLRGEPQNAAYCASKYAVIGWVRAIAPVAERHGVKVRAFCPGCTETPLLLAANERFAVAQGIDPAAFLSDRRERIPIQRFASVAETAAGALYLAEEGVRPLVLAATGGEVQY